MRTALLAVLSTTLGCAHIGGVWSIDVSPTRPISHGPPKLACVFREDHEKLTGYCLADLLRPPLSGEITGDRHVTFQLRTGFNQEGTVTFVGELDPRNRTMKGEYFFDYGDGERRGEFVARQR
jgi:hypothetical protein